MNDAGQCGSLVHAIGLLVVRTAFLETTLVELVVRLAEEAGEDYEAARVKFTGKSGMPLVEELRNRDRHDVADPYEVLAEQRNHLVHGNGWHIPDAGYHVVQAPPSRRGISRPLREKLWQVDEIEALSLAVIRLEKVAQAEVRRGGRLPAAYTVTGPIRDPWVPGSAEIPGEDPPSV